MARWFATAGLLFLSTAPVLALDEPVVWRDPDTGCGYFLTPQGGISPRLRRDGLPDCPDASAGARLMEDTARGLSQGFDALRREADRWRGRLQDQPR